jgi:hypothetical protein
MASLDYNKELHHLRISRGSMEQYDWLTNVFFIGKRLHYGQVFCDGELQAWMRRRKKHGCQHGSILFSESSPEFKFRAQPQILRWQTWPPENSIAILSWWARFFSSDLAWSSEILASGVFIFKSIVGLMNRARQLSSVMSTTIQIEIIKS